jgi:hypothetical protein
MHEAALRRLASTLVEVVRPKFLVDRPLREQVVNDGQDRVAHGYGRTLLPPPRSEAAELRAQIGPFRVPGGMGRFDQDRPRRPVPLAGRAALPLVVALVVARAPPGPRGQVLCRREAAQIET